MGDGEPTNENSITRRDLVGGTAACAVAAMTGGLAPAAFAQPAAGAPRAKGPRVFLDYDQAELDAAYDQIKYAPNQPQVTGRYATNSEAVRARIGAPRRISYGPTDVEKLDIYRTTRPDAPVQVFLHGGAWRGGEAKNYATPAEMFVKAGAHFVVPDFVAVQNAPDGLRTMADQVRRAVAWVYRNAASFGGDPNRIHVSGHSSGGHLAGVVLITEWQKDYGVPADIVKGGLCCSGMYDLRGPRLSARSSYVRFDDAMEDALSAQRHLQRINAPVIVAHGTHETPEFQRQNREFAEALKQAGKPVQFLVAQGYNHFEIIETLANPFGLLGRAVLEQMKLGFG